MHSTILCPFNLNQLTGTPARTKSTIKAVHGIAYTTVIAQQGTAGANEVVLLGKGTGLRAFTIGSLRVLNNQKPQVVYAITTLAIIPALLYRLTHWKTRIIFESHGWSWYETAGKETIVKRFAFLALDVLGVHCADRVICMSHSQKDFLKRWFVREKKMHVIWGPVDTARIYTERSEGIIVVGYLGNASWWQGVPILIEAAQKLVGDSRFTFKLAGFDPESITDISIPENVQLIGKVQAADVQDVLATCDILISPRREGRASDLQYPQKLSSYLTAGRPVIVSKTNDQPHIVERAECGYVLRTLSADAIVEKLKMFADLPHDARKTMSMNAHAFAQEHFVMKSFAKKVADVYRSVDVS